MERITIKNTLVMRTEASYSLNFLVYIQNIYLNQSQQSEELKFPYMPTKCEFREDFEMRFSEFWDKVLKRISDHPKHDIEFFIKERTLFYQWLFTVSDDNLDEFDKIYKSFKAWWDSFAGRFSIERSIDEKAEKIYAELANWLIEKEITPDEELNISLIYDECLLADLKPSSYFAVLSIRDCFINSKELIAKLQLSMY